MALFIGVCDTIRGRGSGCWVYGLQGFKTLALRVFGLYGIVRAALSTKVPPQLTRGSLLAYWGAGAHLGGSSRL